MKRYLMSPVFAIAALLLTGCEMKIKNLTPTQLPQAQSGVYNLAAEIRPTTTHIVNNSIVPKVTINGQTYRMRHDPAIGPNVYSLDYKMPDGANIVSYYFAVAYDIDKKVGVKHCEDFTHVFKLELVNRFVVRLDADRGCIGTTITAVGRGFSPSDKIHVGGIDAETKFISSNALSFQVPALPVYQLYDVILYNARNEAMLIGKIRVDPAMLKANVSSLDIRKGDKELLVFEVENPAPAFGLPIEITTDIPKSVIIPEILMPAGARTISVSVRGGEPGNGHLFVKATGYEELQIPVNVTN